jgi:hypothetical protein
VRHPVQYNGASSSRSSDEAEVELRNPRFGDFQDLYEITNEVHHVCLLADIETISFEEAIQDPK